MADLKALVDELSKLTVLEAAELSKMLEEEWGVSAAAPVAVAAAGGAAAGAAAAEEKPNSTLSSLLLVTRKSTSLKKYAASPVLASKKPKTWLKALRKPSKKALLRTKPKKSRRSWKKPAQPSNSNNRRLLAKVWVGVLRAPALPSLCTTAIVPSPCRGANRNLTVDAAKGNRT